MDFLVSFIIFVVSSSVCYRIGFSRGISENLQAELVKIVKHLPVNIEITFFSRTYYAHYLVTEVFIAQNESKSELVEHIKTLFPDRTVVFSELNLIP